MGELARIQAYSSVSLTTNDEQLARLKDALDWIDHAVAVAPDDSNVHAIRALVLDWYANPVLIGDQVASRSSTEAENEASLALTGTKRIPWPRRFMLKYWSIKAGGTAEIKTSPGRTARSCIDGCPPHLRLRLRNPGGV